MNTVAVLATALALASGASAAVAAQATDVDYLKASRCRGLAVGLGADASGLAAFVKSQGQARAPFIQERADEEFARAKREARGDAKERVSAEFAGACSAYAGPTKAVASQ